MKPGIAACLGADAVLYHTCLSPSFPALVLWFLFCISPSPKASMLPSTPPPFVSSTIPYSLTPHLYYKSERCAYVITGPRAVFEPMTYEMRHCMDTNESQSACGNQLGDRLIPSPPFSVREQETNTEKRTPAVLPVPKHFSLKSAPTAERLGSIFSPCSLVYRMHV